MAEPDHSHAATARIPTENGGAASPTSHIVVQHHRTPAVEWSVASGTGGHMLHLALAQCVFNNLLRMAHERGVTIDQLDVVADGGFNAEGTASTGIGCSIELRGDADRSVLTDLAEAAFADSTVAAVLRRGGSVELVSVRVADSSSTPLSTT
jgi:uncharacterized OsmC-like protein